MDESQLRTWLDTNNQKLLVEIEIEYKIPVKFTLWEKDSYGCQVHKNEQGAKCEVEVYYKEPPTQAKIAHELLHAKVDLVLGDGITLFDVPNMTKTHQGLLQNADQIVNACEHYIFFPEYLDMGYLEKDSFEEYETSDKFRERLESLCQHGLKQGLKYNIDRVFQCLSLAFTLCFYPNEERFATEKNRLKKVDRVLYNKVDELREACEIDIDSEFSADLQNAYRKFSRDMNSWFRANGFK